MRASTKEMMGKVKTLLIDKEYLTAKSLGEKCKLSANSVHRIIRIMRENGTGVMPTPKGYVLAEFATKGDDVHLWRRVNGRHTGDYITLIAAEPHMRHRWRSVEDKKTMAYITGPLVVNYDSLEKGRQLLLDAEKALKI